MMRIVLIFVLPCSPAVAHDPSRPDLNNWFDHLASGKGLCCSFADGFAVSDVDWESKDGHYRVRTSPTGHLRCGVRKWLPDPVAACEAAEEREAALADFGGDDLLAQRYHRCAQHNKRREY
jgi:hypothetical protein